MCIADQLSYFLIADLEAGNSVLTNNLNNSRNSVFGNSITSSKFLIGGQLVLLSLGTYLSILVC